MRKGFKTFISLMLVFCMIIPSITSVVSAADSSTLPVYDPEVEMAKWYRVETFDNRTVGQALSSDFTKGAVANYNGQKAFKMSPKSSGLTNQFRQLAIGEYCVSFDIAAPNTNFKGTVKVEGGGDCKRVLVEFDSGKILNHSGTQVGTVSSAFTRITVVADPTKKKYSMWVGGNKVTTDATFNSHAKTDKAYMIFFNMLSNDSSAKDIYLDNVVVQSTGVKSDYCPVYNANAYEPREMELTFTNPPDRVYTEKYGSFSSVTSGMSGRTAIHMRSGVIYDGTGNNRRLDNMPYEEDGEFMVPVDAFSSLLGVTPTVSGSTITLGTKATLTLGQKTATLNGNQKTLLVAPVKKDGVIYLPLSAIATDGFSKKIYHEKYAPLSPGAVIIGNTTYTPPTKNDALQFLNDMIFAERPTWQEIDADYYASPLEGQHPRIFITSEGVENLKAEIASSSLKKNWYNNLITKANSNIGRAKFEWYLPDGVRMLSQASTFEYYIRTQGMAYLLTGDEKYAKDAWEKIVSVAMMPDWNHAHALDAGTYAGGFALAYDWFYDWLSEDQKDFMYNHAYRNFMWYANESYKGVDFGMDSSVIYRHNWNSVVNSGTILSALAFFDEDPEFCSRLISEAIRCMEYVIQQFGPDGYWEEGVSYLHMTLFYTVMALASLETVLGDCYTLDAWQGFDKAADQLTYAQSDVSGYNYGNAEMGWGTTIALFWFFDHFNMEGIADTLAYKPRFKNSTSEELVNLLMWYRPTGGDEPTYALDKIWYSDVEDVVTARNNYDDGQVFVGFKSRTLDGVNRDHGHMDSGSFVFDAQGVRWAYDMGKDDYNLPGYQSGGSDKFKIFRLRASGHNTLIINPSSAPEHAETGGGGIVEYVSKPGGVKAVIDMTEALTANVTEAKRGFLFTDDRTSLVIRDEVALKSTSTSKLMWLMYIKANYEVNGNTVILTDTASKDKKVKVEFVSSVPGTARVESAAPLSTAPVVSGQSNNSEFKRLVYEVNGTGNVSITAKITPLAYEGSDIDLYNVPISTWTVPGEEPEEPEEPVEPADPVWGVVGSGSNKANATDVEIVNMGGVWLPGNDVDGNVITGNPKFNVIIPDGATDVEIKVNGLVRPGTWEKSDTSNNYIIQLNYPDCCFAGENEVTVTATYPSGTKSATGKFHAVGKGVGFKKIKKAGFSSGSDLGGVSVLSATPTYATLTGSLNGVSTDKYMIFTGPQSNARLISPFDNSYYSQGEKYINFRYYTSSDDAEVKFNYTAGCEAANPVILPAEAGKWFTVGVWQEHLMHYDESGNLVRNAYVYVNGEYAGKISHANFKADTGAKVNFNPGPNSSDFIAFDYWNVYRLNGVEAAHHTSYPLGTDAYDADAGFSAANFKADETKTFPVGTKAVAIRVSKASTTLAEAGKGGLNGITTLYKDGQEVDSANLTFTLIKDTEIGDRAASNDADWYILVESKTGLGEGFYTVSTDPNEPFCGDTSPLVSVGGTFTIAPPTRFAFENNGTAYTGSSLNIKADVTAPSNATSNARVVFAVYNDDGVLTATRTASFTAGSTVPYDSGSISVGSGKTGMKVKAYAIDVTNLKPLTDEVTTVWAQ